MKILIIISLLLACNLLLRIFSRRRIGVYWDWRIGRFIGNVLMISSLIYQSYYWFTKFGII